MSARTVGVTSWLIGSTGLLFITPIWAEIEVERTVEPPDSESIVLIPVFPTLGAASLALGGLVLLWFAARSRANRT